MTPNGLPSALHSGAHITERMRKSVMLWLRAMRLSAAASSLRKAWPVSRHFRTMLRLKRALASSCGRRVLTTFGMSRDDAEGKFLQDYVEGGILEGNPFMSVDEKGVGALIEIATERGRVTDPDLEVGICGEHGGDPKSIDFCYRAGLDYVSCSPFRVPTARLAAAHAKLRSEGKME